MGSRARARIQLWAAGLIADHGADVARVVGLDGPLPRVGVHVQHDGPPGSTSGLEITLSERWFRGHPDDAGCVLHELAHAYMNAPRYDGTTSWLIEGLGDHVRDTLGFDAAWTFAHYESGKATAGYQTTAHFLAWLDRGWPGTSVQLSRRLMAGTYADGDFEENTGCTLAVLIADYESDEV